MRARALGGPTRGMLSFALWTWIIPGGGGLTLTTAPLLEPEENVDSVRLRLGCAGPTEPVACAACQCSLLDSGEAHATCCGLGEATRGHNADTTSIHAAAQSCDHAAAVASPLAPTSGLLTPRPSITRTHRPGLLDLLSARPASGPRLHPP